MEDRNSHVISTWPLKTKLSSRKANNHNRNLHEAVRRATQRDRAKGKPLGTLCRPAEISCPTRCLDITPVSDISTNLIFASFPPVTGVTDVAESVPQVRRRCRSQLRAEVNQRKLKLRRNLKNKTPRSTQRSSGWMEQSRKATENREKLSADCSRVQMWSHYQLESFQCTQYLSRMCLRSRFPQYHWKRSCLSKPISGKMCLKRSAVLDIRYPRCFRGA